MKQLETFYWATKLGSFAATADHLGTTQSTVSMRIQELERDFGVALFDRQQRSARATAKGREMMYYAERVLHLTAKMRERIAGAESGHGVLRIGVVEVVSVTWLPRLIKLIHERFPNIQLELDEALMSELIDRLNQGSPDLIMAPGQVPGMHFSSTSLGKVQFAWMASPALGVPKEKLTAADLQRWPVIALSLESYHHKSIEDWFRAGNAHCRRIDTCKSLNVAASLAEAGLGITSLPVRCFQQEIEQRWLEVVDAFPAFPPVEFTATSSIETTQPVATQIARLACKISKFDKSTDEPGAG